MCFAYFAKTLQCFAFTVLLIYLVYRQIKGETYVGRILLFVVCLVIVNAVAVVVRVNALFPHDPTTYSFESF